jgi:acyl CoA:acetate/3-ketoacid CoA transferase beta subunit
MDGGEAIFVPLERRAQAPPISAPAPVSSSSPRSTTPAKANIVRRCTYPLTALGVVEKVYTDIAVLRLDAEGFLLEEIASGWTAEEVQSQCEATVRLSPDLREIDLT